MNKRYQSIIIAALVLVSASCNKWLDVYPKEEIGEQEMFGTTEGFYNVLNGIYLELGENSLYGKNLSWGAMEAWGNGYQLKENFDPHAEFFSLKELHYDDKGPQAFGESIWKGLYHNIAVVNMFIRNAEQKPLDFFKHGEVEQRLLLGEAYALRGMMHFDLLRVFGGCMARNKEDRNASVMPYVEVYPSTVNPSIPSKEVIGKVKADLEKGADMVAAYDTLHMDAVLMHTNRFDENSKADWGLFYSSRGTRLNLLAIRLLQARVALYDEDYEKAIEYAGVIEQHVSKRQLEFESSLTGNPKMIKETLFAFHQTDLMNQVETWFKEPRSNDNILLLEDPNMFPMVDNRKKLVKDKASVIFLKDKNENLIPSLKISEAYYILAESYLKTGDREKAIKTFNTFLSKRSVYPNLAASASEDKVMEFIVKDAKREFMCLGQAVFYYKRLDLPVLTGKGPFEASKGHLQFPVPHSESMI